MEFHANKGIIDFFTNDTRQLYMSESTTNLYYNGSKKFETTDTGTKVTGSLVVTGASVCADGVQCAIRIEDADGTLLNTC